MRLAGTCGGSVRSLIPIKGFGRVAGSCLVGNHSLQFRLIGFIGDYSIVQLVLTFA
jgi:hypothetical protein